MQEEELLLDPVNKKLIRMAESKQALCIKSQKILSLHEKAIKIQTGLPNRDLFFESFHPQVPSSYIRSDEKGVSTIVLQNRSYDYVQLDKKTCLGRVKKSATPITDVRHKNCQTLQKNKSVNPPIDPNILSQVQTRHLPAEWKMSYERLITTFSDVFSVNPNDIGNCNTLPQQILLQEPSKITNIPPYRTPTHLQPVVKHYVENLLESGVIQRSTSPFCSPLLLIRKANSLTSQPLVEQYRVVHDFRSLNSNTIRDSYPLHNLYDLVDKVAAAKVWSVIDLSSGFWNQQLEKNSRAFTAFAVPGVGHFEYTRSAQGLCNSPAAFQRLLDFVVRDLPNVYVYIDDLVIASSNHKDHLATMGKVFERFRQYNLKCRPHKIQIATAEINYLGYNLSHSKGIRPGIAKTQCIRDWKSPTSVKEIRQFLGLCSFFRRTIRNFASIASPLTQLTRKDASYQGGPLPPLAHNAFIALQSKLASRPCVSPPNFQQPFILTVDASTTGLGAILSQTNTDGMEHPIAYASRVLTEAEKKKAPFHLEYLAMVWACRHFKPYLVGKRFVLRSDHKPLQVLNRKSGQAFDRYLLELAEYDFSVEYLKGEKMPADGLSRMTATTTTIKDHINFSWSQVKSLQKQDKEIKAVMVFKLYNSLPNSPALQKFVTDNHSRSTIIDNVLCSTTQNPPVAYAPAGLRQTLLNMAHDCPGAGHYSYDKTQHRLATDWFWPTMAEDIKWHCRSCHLCITTNRPPVPPAHLQPLSPAHDFNHRIHIDLLGPLPENNGFKYVLVMVDAFSKFLHLAPLQNKTMDAVAEEFFSSWIATLGIPHMVVSDLGSEFKNQLFTSLQRSFNFTHKFSSVNHPASNGQAESSVKETLRYIRKYVSGNEWLTLLPNVRLAHNTSFHSSIKTTPYQATFCRQPLIPTSIRSPKLLDQRPYYGPHFLENQLKHMHTTRHDIIENAQAAFCKYKTQFDKKAKARHFEPGDKVYTKRAHKPNQFQKFQPPYTGPYIVQQVGDNGNLTVIPYDPTVRPRSFRIHKNNVKLAEAALQFIDSPAPDAIPEVIPEVPQDPAEPSAPIVPEDPILPPVRRARKRNQTKESASAGEETSSSTWTPQSQFSPSDSLHLTQEENEGAETSFSDSSSATEISEEEEEEEDNLEDVHAPEEEVTQAEPQDQRGSSIATRTRSTGIALPDDVLQQYLPLRQRKT